MGGGGSKSAPVNALGVPVVHVAKKDMFGKVVRGGFSAGPKTMEKIRTRSDFCLLKIVEQVEVRKAFALWAHAENVKEGAVYLDFVLDVNDMKNESNAAAQKMKVLDIFTTYIPQKSAKKKLVMDSATRKTIMLAFESFTSDSHVYDLAYEKAYQCLKFDHMPQFLISDTFMKLEQGTQVRRGSSSKVIELSSILTEANAKKALMDFLNERNDPGNLFRVRLWEDINDFKLDYEKQSPADQTKRATKIWDTVTKEMKLPSHLRVLTNENVTGNSNPNSGPGVDCFDDLSNFLCDSLQAEIQRPFLVSQHYSNFLTNASDEYKLDSVVMTLAEFKDDRQLKQTKDSYVADLKVALRLENVLGDPLLSAYFRRFLRVSFQEENYLFFQDVQSMKEKYFVKHASDQIGPKMTLQEILEVAAQSIFDKFVKAGSMYQVNISAVIRDEIIEKFGKNQIDATIFDAAQREIFHQMRNGGFMEFKKHDLYNHFKMVHKRKFAQRNFVVGFKGKRTGTMEHYRLKESDLNFDEVADEDKNFSFATHESSKKTPVVASCELDFITKQNLKDFEKDMSKNQREDEEKKGDGPP
mmetsp:Transcript_10150/g.20200  ORF Transcript_10150/g.20200 Transcript_10150/m.20200 type:complete len:583 (+) Transcript_10150:70-1818(+)|eukprot:CAMPEP_0182473774 /NCGR_PEP_ID=MMETSP1319-20130603/24534_1 /TAXON_ID=172717 /ORGANISM="Bolidomonas pacifica, Strain RCC208" /LENGTH=582 /DNA_ID=CAMNT_0024674607 /DNA_START=61 /DNA_END=1809 /DNA_ORIENTATION=-